MTLPHPSRTVLADPRTEFGSPMDGVPGEMVLTPSETRRARVRGAAVTGWTVGLFACWCLTMPASALRRRWFLRYQAYVLRIWGRGTARLLGLRIRVRGDQPARPFFLVCNHLSYIDIVVLCAQIGGAFVSKAELEGWPVLGFIARAMGTIFIDRSSKRDAVRTLARIQETIEGGAGVIVFPEGTSSAGAAVMPFKAALLDYPARTGLPVHVATISYATLPDDPPAHLAVCWWGEMTFLPHARRLAALRRVEVVVTFVEETVIARDRRTLANRLHTAVSRSFIPVVSLESS